MTGAKQKSVIAHPAVWRLLVVALLAEIGYAVLNISTMPVYLKAEPTKSIISNGRGFGESVISLVIVAFLLSEAIFKSPMGHLADRIGPKRLMMFGPLLSVGTAILSLVVPHGGGAWEVLAFILLRAIDGLGAAMLWPAAFSEMGAAVDDSQRQQAMSFLNLCYMLGIALALPIGGYVDDLTGTRWAGLILAACLFAGVSASVALFVPTVEKVPHADGSEHGEFKIGEFIQSLKQIPAYLLLSVVTYAGIGFPMAIIKIFAQDAFNMSESAFGSLVFPAAILMAAASVPMAKFGERIGRVRAVHYGMGTCAAGLLLIAAGAIVPWMRQVWVLVLGSLPVGIGFLLAIPAWMASVSDIDPKKRGANLGAVMTAQGLGAIIGAPLGGVLYEKLQPVGVSLGLGKAFGYYSPWVGCAACVTFGWLIGMRILREPK
ncbi:MAG TPA: MFS transporter [Fimbriimonadaceae bacterium]|nr:MFS transporter [Fimbriimonadaceae bacterium]